MPSAAGQLGLARASQAAAQSPWAAPPSLELARRGEPLSSSSGLRESEIGIIWPLLLPGQRSARGASAQADLDTAGVAQRAAKLRIAGEVRNSAWIVVAREADRAIAEAHARTIERLATDVQRRVEAGDLARADALAARAEHLAAAAAEADAHRQVDAARTTWRVLTGVDAVPDGSEPPVDRVVEDHPELVLARLKAEGARRRLELVRATRSDPPELAIRYRHEVPASNLASENSVGVAVRIPFGTDDRNLPREASALADVDIAQAEERRVRELLAGEMTIALAAANAATKQLGMEESRASLLRERAQLIEKAFSAGNASLPELLRALAAAAQAEGELARQRAAWGLARAKHRQALGVLP